MKPQQDDLSRRRRLNKGQCPTHGVALVLDGAACTQDGIPYADIVRCPRKPCHFWTEVRPGTKLWEALNAVRTVDRKA